MEVPIHDTPCISLIVRWAASKAASPIAWCSYVTNLAATRARVADSCNRSNRNRCAVEERAPYPICKPTKKKKMKMRNERERVAHRCATETYHVNNRKEKAADEHCQQRRLEQRQPPQAHHLYLRTAHTATGKSNFCADFWTREFCLQTAFLPEFVHCLFYTNRPGHSGP